MPILIKKRNGPAQKDLCKVISACPKTALQYQDDENKPLGGKIIVIADKCDLCGARVDARCSKAIEILV
jgi:ferredoxin